MTDDSQEIPANAGQAPGFTPPPGPVPPGQYGFHPVYSAPKHPQATTVLLVGLAGLFVHAVSSWDSTFVGR